MGRRPKGWNKTPYGTLALPRGFGPQEPTPEIASLLERLALEGYPIDLALVEAGVDQAIFTRWTRVANKGEEPYHTMIGRLAMAEAKGRGQMVSRAGKNAITASKMLEKTSPGIFSTKAANTRAVEQVDKEEKKERTVIETPVQMTIDEWNKTFNK